MPKTNPATKRLVCFCVGTALFLTLSLPGCYKRVVSAQGIGATSISVNKSERSNTALDRWFDRTFGDPPPDPTRVRTVSVPQISSGGSWQRSAAAASTR